MNNIFSNCLSLGVDRIMAEHNKVKGSCVDYWISLVAIAGDMAFKLYFDKPEGVHSIYDMSLRIDGANAEAVRRSLRMDLIRLYGKLYLESYGIYQSNIRELAGYCCGSSDVTIYLAHSDRHIKLVNREKRDSLKFEIYRDYCQGAIKIEISGDSGDIDIDIAEWYLLHGAMEVAMECELNRNAINRLCCELADSTERVTGQHEANS
jgi:hypothetical protein